MKLFVTPLSPFSRKVRMAAVELGLADRLELVRVPTAPVSLDADLAAANPLGKVPALVADEGETLFDSAVIVDYLDALAGGGRIIPATGPARWRVKCVEALADGMVDAVVLMRHERTARPADKQWPPSFESQKLKVDRALDSLEGQAWLFDDRLDAGRIAIGCGLGYLDLRFPDHGWRQRCEILARWYDHFLLNPAAAATWPVVPPEQG